MINTTPFTKGPWTICWQTYNGRRTNFDITASPYGSIRPLAGTDWKIEWSEVEGEELVANGNLIGTAPELYEAAARAGTVMVAVAHELGRLGFSDVAGELRLEAKGISKVLAKAEGRS